MTPHDISLLRLTSQQVTTSRITQAKDLVAYMGAMQAQDYPMAKWAIGLRMLKASDHSVQTAIDKGDILRTHVLRPTWHFVPSADIKWMIELTAPHILTSMRSRHKQLGLTAAIVNKSNMIIENALTGGYHATREELVKLLEKAKIKNEDNRAAHLFAMAELECLICSGTSKGIKQTFALLSERVPKAKSLKKEEALATLARRYFQSHGPATIYDFVWWSGLPVKDAKHAVEAVGSEFHVENLEGQQYLFSNTGSGVKETQSLYLLPAYDEFLIGYKDRSPSLSPARKGVTISSNGIFYPLIVLDGKVIGTWKRTMKSNKMLIETMYLGKPLKHITNRILDAAKRYGEFFGLEVTVK